MLWVWLVSCVYKPFLGETYKPTHSTGGKNFTLADLVGHVVFQGPNQPGIIWQIMGWVKKTYKPWNISADGSEIRLTSWDGDKTL